jgi:outer membrane protein assembly factor BamB
LFILDSNVGLTRELPLAALQFETLSRKRQRPERISAMSQPIRRAGRWMLLASVVLFIVFALLAGYHKYHDELIAYFTAKSDPTLLAELASATILDEPESLGGGWPQWRGPRRDGVASDGDLYLDWTEDGPKRLWTVKGGQGFSSFAVFGGKAFTLVQEGNKEVVICLDVNDEGRRVWNYEYSCTFRNDFGSGPRSTPSLDREPCHALSTAAGPYVRATTLLPGDRLYTVGAEGKFHCFDAVTGDKLWQKDLLAEFHAENIQWGVSFSPLVEGDLVITNPGGPNASLVAFDKRSGEVKWATQSDKAGYSSPLAVDAAGRRQILMFTGKSLLSVAPEDGALLWRFTWETSNDVNAATPTVFHAEKDGKRLDYVFITSGYDKGSALLKMGTDDQGIPNVRVVYVGNQMHSQFSSPVRRGDYLYGFNESNLRCIDLKTGKKQWDKDGFHKGSLMRVGDRLLVLGERGELAVLAATPNGNGVELAHAEPFGHARGKCWTMPVLADGKLLLRDEKEIICLELRKQ